MAGHEARGGKESRLQVRISNITYILIYIFLCGEILKELTAVMPTQKKKIKKFRKEIEFQRDWLAQYLPHIILVAKLKITDIISKINSKT